MALSKSNIFFLSDLSHTLEMLRGMLSGSRPFIEAKKLGQTSSDEWSRTRLHSPQLKASCSCYNQVNWIAGSSTLSSYILPKCYHCHLRMSALMQPPAMSAGRLWIWIKQKTITHTDAYCIARDTKVIKFKETASVDWSVLIIRMELSCLKIRCKHF